MTFTHHFGTWSNLHSDGFRGKAVVQRHLAASTIEGRNLPAGFAESSLGNYANVFGENICAVQDCVHISFLPDFQIQRGRFGSIAPNLRSPIKKYFQIMPAKRPDHDLIAY